MESDPRQRTAERITARYADQLSVVEARRLTARLAAALAAGWTEEGITAELDQPTTGLDSVAAGLIGRARDLGGPPPATPAKKPKPPWCGSCDSDRIRQRTIEDPYGGGVRVILCPECNPRSPNWKPNPDPWASYDPHANQPSHAALAAAWGTEPDRKDAA